MVKYWSHTRIKSGREIDPENLLIRKPILMVTKNILQIVIAVIISTREALGFWGLWFWPQKKNSVFRLWCFSWFADFPFFSVWFSLFVKNTIGTSDSVCERVPVSLRSEQQFCASTDLEQLRNLCMLHLSPMFGIDQGFVNWDVKIYRF